MLHSIKELKACNEKLAESVSKLERSKQFFKIESFEIEYVSIYCIEDSADKINKSVPNQSPNKNTKKKHIKYNIRNDNSNLEEKSDLDSTINTLGDGLLSLLKSVRRPIIKNNHHICTSKNNNKDTNDNYIRMNKNLKNNKYSENEKKENIRLPDNKLVTPKIKMI